MEESEKRKERLRAMRMEATRAGSSADTGTPGGIDHLANPMIETTAVNFAHQESRVAVQPRFDYYTDPMAAYSCNRVGSNLDAQGQLATTGYSSSFYVMGPRIPQPNPSPTYQRVPPRGFTHHPSPGAPNSPFQMHRGMSPQSWNASGRATTHFSSPNMGPRSPYPFDDSGRSQHQRFDRSPNPGRTGGRGRAYNGRGSSSGMRSGPEQFYHESMVQDPWKGLAPVLWKVIDFPTTGSNTPESSSSWMPKSLQIKKPRVAETPQKLDSGANLAEFLAAAFNESSNDPADP